MTILKKHQPRRTAGQLIKRLLTLFWGIALCSANLIFLAGQIRRAVLFTDSMEMLLLWNIPWILYLLGNTVLSGQYFWRLLNPEVAA